MESCSEWTLAVYQSHTLLASHWSCEIFGQHLYKLYTELHFWNLAVI